MLRENLGRGSILAGTSRPALLRALRRRAQERA